jgi:hypothetical protein
MGGGGNPPFAPTAMRLVAGEVRSNAGSQAEKQRVDGARFLAAKPHSQY